MVMTDVLVMPGVRPIYVPDLSAAEKTAEIEDLASRGHGLTKFARTAVLLAVAHPSLTVPELEVAWKRAERAIAVRDGTDEDDADYEGYADLAGDRICDLIYGINISTARGGGITPRGNAS
jgi:hypothetical protein